jgi:uncharacterized protein with NRDE domain
VSHHPHFSLCEGSLILIRILGSNRDEVLGRETAPTSFHSFEVDGIEKEFVLSGVDLKAGGSWLGINKHGEVAMLYVLHF